MRSSDALDLVNSAEQAAPVHAWALDGVRIWPLLRVRIYTEALNHGLLQSQLPSRIDRWRELAKRVSRAQINVARAYWRDRKANARPERPVDVVMLSDGVSFVRTGDVWYDKFFDPIITWLSRRQGTYFMMTPMTEAHHPRRSPSAFVQPRLDLVKTIASVAHRAPRHIELGGFAAAMRALAKFAPTAPIPGEDQVFEWWRRLDALRGYFDSVLSRVEPGRAFVNTYYSAEGMAFVLACRRRGIRVADMQHGVQGSCHVAYGRWRNVPPDGYELLPDEFWVWSDDERRTIEEWRPSANNMHIPIVVGNSWLELWRSGSEPFMGDAVARARGMRRPGAHRHVLVTLQWGLANEEALKILRAVRLANDSIEWWVRLHPLVAHDRRQVKEWISKLCGSNVQVDMPTDLPLHAVLQCADIHVTHSSSTVIEAAEFGLGSVITSEYGAQFFPSEIAAGVAVVALSDRDIARSVLEHSHPGRAIAQPRSSEPLLDSALERALPKLRANGGRR